MKILKIVLVFFVLWTPVPAWSLETVGPFTINEIFVSNADNMYFRVIGTDHAVTHCTNGGYQSYVGATDSGAKMKMSALMAAYLSGSSVSLTTEAVDFYGNGQIFCHIIEVGTKL